MPCSSTTPNGRTPNQARFQFLDPASHDFHPDGELFAEMCVAVMCAEAGRDPHHRRLQDLVGELSTRNETCRRLWAAHKVPTITAEPGSAPAGSRHLPGSPAFHGEAVTRPPSRRQLFVRSSASITMMPLGPRT
ncbi:MmyB family transcriptional regulator [Kocuria oxytropis]|uniref:MmyB family transcriptional regulator n=1 Tax=Kocuria oxytropis TaxID=3058913 RepID=UPI003F661A7F